METGKVFKRLSFKGKLLSKWVSFGNDLMNRKLTGWPLKNLICDRLAGMLRAHIEGKVCLSHM
jgi:hypothetical protein